MRPLAKAKAERLLANGAVEPERTPAQHFRVRDDHDRYIVSISPFSRICTCPASGSECSHIRACVSWLAEKVTA